MNTLKKECPTCGSRAPHLHPALQFEGEVEICCDDFHLTKSPQNSASSIEMVMKKREFKKGTKQEG